jgi:hypothetical protein
MNGSCSGIGSCIYSTNYPSKDYPNGDVCSLSIISESGNISAVTFTEQRYDFRNIYRDELSGMHFREWMVQPLIS